MSQIIELPDPLFSEISEYAVRASISPSYVIQQAWKEFRHRQPSVSIAEQYASQEELLNLVDSLRGSLSLPSNVDDKTLIT